MPFFHHDDGDIFYTVHTTDDKPLSESDNTKPPILLIHGWTCDSHDWLFQIHRLTTLGFNLIVPDLRGHGRSSAPQSTYSAAELVSDLVALLHHLRAPPAIIFGHSLGGLLTSQLAVKHPSLARAVVLVDPVYGPVETAPRSAFDALVNSPAAPDLAAAYFKARMYTSASPPGLGVWHRRRVLGTPVHVVQRAFAQTHSPEPGNWALRDRAAAFLKDRKCPRLVVYACFMGKDGAEFEEGLGVDDSRDRVVLMDEIGHWPHQDVPDKFNGVVEGWLDLNGFL